MRNTPRLVNRSDAIQALESGSAHERHRAARALLTTATSADRELLSRVVHKQRIPRIRVLLQDTLRRLNKAPTADDNQPDVAARESAAMAIEDTAKKVVHQVSRLLTFLANAAESEAPDYQSSKTRTLIQRMDRLVRAIEGLGNAASPPVITEFDLNGLISEVIAVEAASMRVDVENLYGASPLLVVGDRGLIDHALTNGIRNAIEASLAVSANDPPKVIVNAGVTDTDFWAVVLDRGIGLPAASHNAKEFGVTTKLGHEGTGLAIADVAMSSLNGEITLSPRDGGGVQFEISRPKAEFDES
jgi:nitrogen fixation/metabolism regulation signal transduction histidine kinase